MKKANLSALLFVCLCVMSCQREMLEQPASGETIKTLNASVTQPPLLAARASSSAECNPDAYIVNLESRVFNDGVWEWVWSIENPNPGNGKNGTAQDLSHWGMQFGTCVEPASIVSAAYSGDGLNWTSFDPGYQADPSQSCLTTPTLKFDFGTSGSAKSYYRLTVNQDYTAGYVQAYYKSGGRTGCCTFYFMGIYGCGGPVEIEIVE